MTRTCEARAVGGTDSIRDTTRHTRHDSYYEHVSTTTGA